MSRLMIMVEETHEDVYAEGDYTVGQGKIDVSYRFEDLQPGDVLPGVSQIILRLVRQGIDLTLGRRDDFDEIIRSHFTN